MRSLPTIRSATGAIRSGMSLVESSIAMVIFVAVLSAVMEFMIATKQLNSLGSAEDDINIAGNRLLQQISDDITQSGCDNNTC